MVTPPTRRELLASGLLFSVNPGSQVDNPPDRLIGYTEFRTNLPTRHENQFTMRACAVRADGSGRRRIGESLAQLPNTWTQFAGWSPDGRSAIVLQCWESSENARWEEKNRNFRFGDGWLVDAILVDIRSGRQSNVTAVDRVSRYNTGLFFWPGDPRRLGFQALIGGNSHPFSMDLDGRNKRDLTEGSKEFAYGFGASPEGGRIAYHKSYQIWMADADGSNARKVETGNPFNFVPQWSPDGSRLLFLSGEHYDCHPHVVRRDGTGLRKLASRGGYRGVVEFLDVDDFHGGSSDVPVWSRDGKWVVFTALREGAVELMRVSLDGSEERLTRSKPGTLNFHPGVSCDGQWLVFGSNRSGARRQYVMPCSGGEARPITHEPPGRGAMWAHWQP